MNLTYLYTHNSDFYSERFYRSAEEVVADRLQQGEDTETRGDGDDQDANSLQGFRLLCFDFTQKCHKQVVSSFNLII